MLVRNVSAFRFRLPLRSTVLLRPGVSISDRAGVVVRVEVGNGDVGWGEASPLPGFNRETADDVAAAARELVHRCEDATAHDRTEVVLRKILHQADPLGLPSLEFAIESAIRTADRTSRLSLSPGSNSGQEERIVAVARLLQGGPEQVIESAEMAVRDGYRCLKLKVGRGAVGEEIEMVKAVHRIAGSDVRLRLDANRAWALSEASEFCRALSDTQVEFLEEPLEDPAGIPALIRDTGMPIGLDESVLTHADFVRDGIVAAAVVKPTVVGMHRVDQIRTWCARNGTKFVPSSSYESCIGTCMIALIALDGTGGQRSTAAGMGTYEYLKEDLCKDRRHFDGPTVRVDEMVSKIRNFDAARLSPIT